MHAYIHAYMRTCVHAYIILTYIHIHAGMQACIYDEGQRPVAWPIRLKCFLAAWGRACGTGPRLTNWASPTKSMG